MSDPQVVDHRVSNGNKAAIVFVHGFGGNPRATWSRFPECLAADPTLRGWDIFSLGYPSTLLLPDIASLWSAEPELRRCPTKWRRGRCWRRSTAIRRWHLSRTVWAGWWCSAPSSITTGWRVASHTCCCSAHRASGWSKPGCSDSGSARPATWASTVSSSRPAQRLERAFARRDHFNVLAVAGDQDEFVPRSSSLDGIPPPGFPITQQMVVPGNHLQMVKPDGPDHLSVKVARAFLSGSTAVSDSALVAAERAGFQAVVRQLRPSIGRLDERALVALALALESLGQPDEAIAALEAQRNLGTDATGVLAGR